VSLLSRMSVVGFAAGMVACGPGPQTCGKRCAPTDTSNLDTGDGVTDPGIPVTVQQAEVSCSDATPRDDRRYDRTESLAEVAPIRFWAGGVAVGDLDGDAVLDILLPGYTGTLFYRGDAEGGRTLDTEILAGLPLDLASGASLVDYDGDDDLDIFVTRFLARDRLLRNDGGVFVDVTEEAGIADVERRSVSSSWADYDGDGDLDLVVGCYGWIDEGTDTQHEEFGPAEPSSLYANNGDGTFTDRSSDLPQNVHDGYTFVAGWHDLNNDMKPDLYVVNDFGVAYPNVLLVNRGGGLLEPDANASALDLVMTGMGLGVADFTGDGALDLVMPEWNGIYLMESTELGFWVQSGWAKGVYNNLENAQKVGWGADFGDVDNDGDLDIPVAFGVLDSPEYHPPPDEPDALFIQDDSGNFTDMGAEWGIDDRGEGRGFVLADLNGDGWLDMVKRNLSAPAVLYESRCGDAGWMRVRLHQEGMNRRAIGARIRVFDDGQRWMRHVVAGGHNHASAGPPEVHFGFGNRDAVHRVEVTWPDGAVSNLFEVPTRQILDITRSP
jgi:enediyne biosynthesis protein E4